jgi:glycine cleavage system transcriptional repressor
VVDLAVTAMGPDRPGLVAALAEVVRDHGANVGDVAMTALSGHVAIVLQVRTDRDVADLADALGRATGDLDLAVTVRPATDDGPPPPPTHLLSVYGEDHPGLLAGVTRVLADAGATIVDLTSRLLDDDDPPTWAVSIELVADREDADLAQRLIAACDDLQVEHQLRRIDGEAG